MQDAFERDGIEYVSRDMIKACKTLPDLFEIEDKVKNMISSGEAPLELITPLIKEIEIEIKNHKKADAPKIKAEINKLIAGLVLGKIKKINEIEEARTKLKSLIRLQGDTYFRIDEFFLSLEAVSTPTTKAINRKRPKQVVGVKLVIANADDSVSEKSFTGNHANLLALSFVHATATKSSSVALLSAEELKEAIGTAMLNPARSQKTVKYMESNNVVLYTILYRDGEEETSTEIINIQ